MVPIDAVSQFLDGQYPRTTSPNAIAVALQVSVADVQTALNRLVVLRRVLQVSSPGSAPSYQGGIALVKQQLTAVYPNSTTAATIASALGLTPSSVQSDLDRLVVLSQAKKAILPVTGVVQYQLVPIVPTT
jgi:hypothetical protein